MDVEGENASYMSRSEELWEALQMSLWWRPDDLEKEEQGKEDNKEAEKKAAAKKQTSSSSA